MKTMKMRYLFPALLCVLQIAANEAKAQLSPMGALYFQNQYLGNPAMAGMSGFNVDLIYRKQWISMPGAPSTQTLTADYAFTDKAGIGLNVYNDRAGLFKRMRGAASYAYHLPVDASGSKLSFGLSLGLMSQRISNESINGNTNDITVMNYNQRAVYIDGDFGIAYNNHKLNIQAAIPNLKGVFKKNMLRRSVDQSTFFSAIGYKMKADGIDGLGIEPKIVYRGVKGFKNILDAGANLTYVNRINFFGMYHTSKNASFGFGINYQVFSILGIYTTTTPALADNVNGNFEIGLRAHLFNK